MDSSSSTVSNETHNTDEIQEALSCMTVNDYENFLNVYQLVTSMDPRVDQTMSKASVDQLLSGELLNQKRFNEVYEHVADEVEDTEHTANGEEVLNDYTFLDVYHHIENWKKRMLPMINTIEDLARESKMIVQTSAAAEDVLKSKRSIFSVPLKQKKKNEGVITNSSHYSLNIGKYIKTEERNFSKMFHQPAATGDDVINTNDAFLPSNNYSKQIPDKSGGVKTVLTLSPTHDKNPGTLLTPSSAYLEVRPRSAVDELEVKTYFID